MAEQGDDEGFYSHLEYLRARSTPKRRISVEAIAWSLAMVVVAYMLFVGVMGILYAR